ncbi:hypothetical protein [Kitasatospora sp. LaBMicrA B282]|uniref:hypothetical protein n=1 Tax=Kitasatospora sp. LaBMicrA B282 TaxID=3420949 RepID=UPI003D0D6176
MPGADGTRGRRARGDGLPGEVARRSPLLGALAALVIIVGVGLLALPHHHTSARPATGATASRALVQLTGLVGSEKADFFGDGRVQQAFAADRLSVAVQHSGSWQMAGEVKQNVYDFAFPASSVAAKAIDTPIAATPVRPFYSPLVVIAHAATADFLKANGLAKQDPGTGVWTFEMGQYLADVQRRLAWSDLTGGHRPPDVAGKIYVATTDPSSSSSASLYLAVMSYLANGGQVVSDTTGIDRVAPLLQYLMANQGALLASSDQLFRDFEAGTGKPLSWTYESEVAEQAMQGRTPVDTVVLYPDTDVQSDHTLVELTKQSDLLAQALTKDPKLVALEADFGFRPVNEPQAMVDELTAGRSPDPARQTVFARDLASLGTFQPPAPTTDVLQKLVAAAVPTGSS